MLVRCIFCSFWSAEDLEADDDVVHVGDGTKTTAAGLVGKEKNPEVDSEPAGSTMPNDVPLLSGDQVTVASEVDFVCDQDEALKCGTEKEWMFNSSEATPIRPESGSVIALPHAESVKRAADLLTQGGLLLTQVEHNRKIIRRLELDEKKGIASWSIDRVWGIFGNPFIKVNLRKARVMSTDKLVKIGAAGRRGFYTFEACDADEAEAICDCLVSTAKRIQEGNV